MINLGSRREVFFDNFLVDEEKTTAEFRIHQPVRKGVAITHDEKWEGSHCLFSSAFLTFSVKSAHSSIAATTLGTPDS